MLKTIELVGDKPVLSTSEVSNRLGINVSGNFIKSKGIKPAITAGNGTYWYESDFVNICQALITHFQAIANRSLDSHGIGQ